MLINDKLAWEITKIFEWIELKTRQTTYKMIISKQVKDRDWETVLLEWIDLMQYKKNPVVLLDHLYKVENIVGKTTRIYLEWNELIADFVFIDTENGIMAEKLYNAWVLKASSIWFISKQRNPNDFSIIEKSELLEWSLVAVPCNQEALSLDWKLFEEAKTKGFIIEEKEVIVAEIPLKDTLKNSLITLNSWFNYYIHTIFANSFVYEKRGNWVDSFFRRNFTISNWGVIIWENETEVKPLQTFIEKWVLQEISEIKTILKSLTDDKVENEEVKKQEQEALEKKQTLQAIDNAVGEALKNLKLLSK